jgi:hypothetical protein
MRKGAYLGLVGLLSATVFTGCEVQSPSPINASIRRWEDKNGNGLCENGEIREETNTLYTFEKGILRVSNRSSVNLDVTVSLRVKGRKEIYQKKEQISAGMFRKYYIPANSELDAVVSIQYEPTQSSVEGLLKRGESQSLPDIEYKIIRKE